MHRRYESMTARNGDVEVGQPGRRLGHRRARPGRFGLGLLRRPRPRRSRRAPTPGAAPPRSPRPARSSPAPATGLRARRRRSPARGPASAVIDPFTVVAVRQGRPARAGHGDDARARRRPRRGDCTSCGRRASGSSPARGTASTSTSASAAPGSWRRRSATARRSAARTRRRAASTAPAAGSWSSEIDLEAHAARVGAEARELLSAPPCPSGETTLILGGEQMALQIHESVGHAIELDRILGWEAAYAGTSWLDLAQLGSMRYGSELMNITIDPTIPGALGSFGFDDEGTPAAPRDAVRDGTWVGRARRARLGRRRRARLRRQRARRRLGPPADGADDQRRPRARAAHARRDHRRHRRRDLHGDQPLVVDRRPAAQLPVRHRGRLRGQGRPARPAAAQPDLHRHRPAVLGVDGHALVGDRRRGARPTAARASPARSATPATRPPRPGSATSASGCAA